MFRCYSISPSYLAAFVLCTDKFCILPLDMYRRLFVVCRPNRRDYGTERIGIPPGKETCLDPSPAAIYIFFSPRKEGEGRDGDDECVWGVST